LSQKLIDRNDELRRLRDEGYNVEVKSGYLVLRDVPYVGVGRVVKRGTLIFKLDLAGNRTTSPSTHIAHFDGDYPCNADGTPIEKIRHQSGETELAPGLRAKHSFSAKPKEAGRYEDYYHQASTYCAILAGQARVLDPSVNVKSFAPPAADVEDDTSPFHYTDTASSRADIAAITAKLAGERVAIVGLGGTGAYVLDFVAKTPVDNIHLFDGDEQLTHNAFRSPGAASLEVLRNKPKKVDYLAAIYSNMHRRVVPHPKLIDANNVESLREMSFVFICIDDGPSRKLIAGALDTWGIPYADTGMGLYASDGSLGGIVRVTGSMPGRSGGIGARASFADGSEHNEYRQNIQIAELNALNAALAVVWWKKLRGFYANVAKEHHCTYGVEAQALTRGDEIP
jgi:hypothetical protein